MPFMYDDSFRRPDNDPAQHEFVGDDMLEAIMDWLHERDHDLYLEMGERDAVHHPRIFDKIQKKRLHIYDLMGIASSQRERLLAAIHEDAQPPPRLGVRSDGAP